MIVFRKKAAVVALSAVLLISMLSACGGKDNSQTENGSMVQGMVYVPEYISLPDDIGSVENISCFGDMIYLTVYGPISMGSGEQETETTEPDMEEAAFIPEEYGYTFYNMKTDGTELTRMEEYTPIDIPEDKEGYIHINSICPDGEGNLWVAETGRLYHFDASGNYVNDGTVAYLRKLDKNGAELSRADIAKYAESTEYFYIQSIAADNEGRLYMADQDQRIMAFGADGGKLFELETTTWNDSLITLADGRVAALTYEEGVVLKTIDPAARSWGESYSLPMNTSNIWTGSGEYGIYCSDSSYLLGINTETGETVKILNWVNCDIHSDSIINLSVLPSGEILCFLRSIDHFSDEYQVKFEMVLISERPADQVPQKTVLTLATLYTNYDFRAAVINFNKKNEKYRIEIKDYEEFNTPEDYNAGLLKLSTEIISGNVPDILLVNNLPYKQYIGKGLLEDLYPFIDADEALGGRDALMSNVLSALEKDGGLYQIAPYFSVITAVGSSSVVGPDMGWTVDEVSALMEILPEDTQILQYMTSSGMLYYLCAMDMDNYVDWNTGECSFDSPGFIKLLEFASKFPKDFDYESMEYVSEISLIQEGKLLLSMTNVREFEEIQMYEAMFGGKVTFKGFPCESGTGSAFSFSDGLAMTTKCRDKDGAWEFMRYLLTEEYQNSQRSWQLPTNKAAFDSTLEEAMEKEYITDENGQQVEVSKGGWGWDGLMVELYATTQEQVDQIMELIEKTDKVLSFDQSIMEIINEEAQVYFGGQKSAAETAAVIQNRVELYVNEQR
jgi:ABC-type glycerol-3-phosphate transport system substrate-binding protein